MQIKRFRAKNVSEALIMIKREFGPDAVILSAKTLKNKGNLFGYGNKAMVEVTAATDNNNVSPVNIDFLGEKIDVYKSLQSADKSKMAVNSAGENIRRLYDRREIEFGKNHDKDNNGSNSQLLENMLDFGVCENIAARFIQEIDRQRLSIEPNSRQEPKQCMMSILEHIGITAKPVQIVPGVLKTICLAGPAGVGKTTTTAKLAAYFAIRVQLNAAVITLDDFRIGAVEQLGIYAKIIGIPMEVASNAVELKESLQKLKDYDVVIIDTPGISQNNRNKVNKLISCLEKLNSVEIHLILSATTGEKNLIDMVKRFKTVPVDRIIFTKLDEASSYENIFSLLASEKFPVSFITNGQIVPDDIEAASLGLLVDLLLKKKEICKDLHAEFGRYYRYSDVDDKRAMGGGYS